MVETLRRVFGICGVGALVAGAAGACAATHDIDGTGGDDAGSGTAQLHVAVTESAAARAVVASIQRRFQVTDRAPGAPSGLAPGALGLAPAGALDLLPVSVLGEAEAESFGREGAWLRPRIGERALAGVARVARVSLPERANGAFTVAAESTGLSMQVSLVGALDAPAEIAGGFVVYRGGGPGGTDLVHRATAVGTEDFVVLEQAPTEPSVRYEVALSDEVAGMRLVAGTVELLDAGGAPRLRMAPPYLVDAAGARHDASVAIEGCAFDSNPAAPWGRPVTPPGARQCTVRIDWDGDAVGYPALLDPSWTTTGSMATGRYWHTASVLGNGRVLVAGGSGGGATAELYDPTTGAWAITGSLATGRNTHTASVLGDGRVVVVGGFDGSDDLSSAELYDPATGGWATTGSLATARSSHTASMLGDGRVLMAGGRGGGIGGSALSSAELYDPVTGGWTSTGSLGTARISHTASVLGDGRVLVAAGASGGASAELYNPATGTWATTGSLATGRYHHTASVLGDGRVLVAGGFGVSSPISSAELYNPATGGWTTTGSLTTARVSHTASVLGDGRVLVAGGSNPGTSAELYNPTMGTWANTGDLAMARMSPSASVLGDGRVLVAGGLGGGQSAELYDIAAPLGTPCSQGAECTSGHCVDGVCCNTACHDGTCQQGNCKLAGVGGAAGAGGIGGAAGVGGTGGSGGITGGTGGGTTGGTGGTGGASGAASPTDEGGCGCRAAGSVGGVGSGWFALLGLGVVFGRRWRRAGEAPCLV